MNLLWLLWSAAAAAAFLAWRDRWIPPPGSGSSPFGPDVRPCDQAAASLMGSSVIMLPVPSGLSLGARIVPAASQPRALAVVVHGLCLSGLCCLRLAASLATSGIASVLLDLHGHGLSEGRRGAIPPRSEIDADLGEAIVGIAKHHPGLPLLLIGHSAGAELLLSPQVITRLEAVGLTVAGACGLAPYFAGRGTTQRPFDMRRPLFSINPRGLISRRWPAIRYNLPRAWSGAAFQATFDRSLFRLSAATVEPATRLRDLHRPVLLLVGEDDAIISPAAVEALQSAQVRTIRVAGADHMSIIAASGPAILQTLMPAGSHADPP